MRKVALAMILIASFSMGLPFALAGHWWWVVICILAITLWLWPSKYGVDRRANISLFILAVVGGVGPLIGHHPVWQLTNFLFLLMAWDLDHYQRARRVFMDLPAQENQVKALFYAHLKRLAVVGGLGWCLGMVALNIRIQINFAWALILVFLFIFGLREFVRYLAQLRFPQNDG